MSEPSVSMSKENLNTLVAVAFVLGLFAVAMNLWNHSTSSQMLDGLLAMEQASSAKVTAIEQRATALEAATAKIADLERRIGELEAKAAAPPVADAAPTAP